MAERDEGSARSGGIPAEKARQGRIVLNTRPRRLVFIAGLVGLVILALLLRVCAAA